VVQIARELLPFMYRFLLVVALALFGAGCSTIQIDEEDVFIPKPSVTPESFAVDGVQLHEHYFAVNDSVSLNAWHLTQPEAEATVLFFGGNGFYLVQSLGYIRALTGLPVNALLWDYRGYGTSDGSPSVPAFKADALAAYQFATDSLGADPSQLLLHGHSLGTFLASYVATEREAAGVVLENPATDVQGWVRSVIPWYIRLFVNVEIAATLRQESNLERLRTLDRPLLIVGGTEDQVTAPEMARTLHEEASSADKQLVMVDGGGHNELYKDEAYKAAYRQLLDTVAGR
jgi:alpha-beta hydrolase superfamily lysophospholipase